MQSILTSTKKMLGIQEDYEYFDQEIIAAINTALMELTQIGVGPSEGYRIEDEDSIWEDFVPDINRLEAVKSYVYLKVKLLFDPPNSATLMEATNRQIERLEWRLCVAVDPPLTKEENQNG